MTDRQTDGQTDRQTDRKTDTRGKTIYLQTLKGGDIIVIYDLRPTYSFLPFPDCSYEMVAFAISQIYLMIYLIDITKKLTKYVIKLAKNLNFCAI